MVIFVDGKRRSVSHKGDIASLLRKLGVRREEAVVKLNGELAPDTARIGANDRIDVVRVVFGG